MLRIACKKDLRVDNKKNHHEDLNSIRRKNRIDTQE